MNPTILYSDVQLLVIDKPAGLLSIPDGYDRAAPHLLSLLEPSYGRLWVLHRLDKETSGVMVLARNAEAQRALNSQFDSRQVAKVYHALIDGALPADEINVDAPLRISVGRRKRTAVDLKHGKPALTYFRLLTSWGKYALIEAQPQTGRTHQIRAHLFHLGIAILSDPLYGPGRISPLIGRLALHARSLSFLHPEEQERLTFEAPYPADFENALEKLGAL